MESNVSVKLSIKTSQVSNKQNIFSFVTNFRFSSKFTFKKFISMLFSMASYILRGTSLCSFVSNSKFGIFKGWERGFWALSGGRDLAPYSLCYPLTGREKKQWLSNCSPRLVEKVQLKLYKLFIYKSKSQWRIWNINSKTSALWDFNELIFCSIE